MRMLISCILFCFSLFSIAASAVEFAGPAEWQLVNTNAVEKWQEESRKRIGDDFLVLQGVVADKKRKEVRLLAEAVGHSKGTTAEFMLVGPRSDRAYESLAVTVASPDEIVKAVEFLGIKRGSCVNGLKFHFVPCGERFQLFCRRLDVSDSEETQFRSLLEESNPEDPMLSDRGFVFAGGDWEMKEGKLLCTTAAVTPCSVVSLYNELSVFDIPWQAGQSAVYGRLSIKEALPYGTLLEVIVRPASSESTVLPVNITVVPEKDGFSLNTECGKLKFNQNGSVKDIVEWLRSHSEKGKDLFVNLKFNDKLSVVSARDAAALFEILSNGGVNLYGKAESGVYYKAFLPQDEWREREGRNPQPFEVHVMRNVDGNVEKKLVFIEEDWNVKGIDPKLTPKEYPFKEWSELKPLVEMAGGKDNKVAVLFFFVPADMLLNEFMPGVDALSERLPLVHIFSEK